MSKGKMKSAAEIMAAASEQAALVEVKQISREFQREPNANNYALLITALEVFKNKVLAS